MAEGLSGMLIENMSKYPLALIPSRKGGGGGWQIALTWDENMHQVKKNCLW